MSHLMLAFGADHCISLVAFALRLSFTDFFNFNFFVMCNQQLGDSNLHTPP